VVSVYLILLSSEFIIWYDWCQQQSLKTGG